MGSRYALTLLAGLALLALAKAPPEAPVAQARFVAAWLPAVYHAAAVNPHGEIALSCESCHTPDAWRPLREDPVFDHDRQTGFPLTGRHELASCRSCHLDLVFSEPQLIADGCQSCHVDVHQGHLGPTCSSCHNTVDFALTRAEAVHAQTTFPLTGMHRLISCESCHADAPDGRFAPIDADCYACHAPDYHQAAFDHAAAGFPTTCESCHGTLTFSTVGGFDHVTFSGGFALVGAHTRLACGACHQGADFSVPWSPAGENDCYACHAQDHEQVHPSFPTTCTQCHTVQTWQGATFDHDPLFPIFSGRHAGEWNSCQSCHIQQGTFEVFSCLNCHAHRRDRMDDKHEDVPGYAYESQSCFACHPTGED